MHELQSSAAEPDMIALDYLDGPYDSVLDVGGNLGDFAAAARQAWPDARVTSFEPIAEVAAAQTRRAAGRWWVECVALSDRAGEAMLNVSATQHSASSLQPLGGVRRREFGIADRLVPERVLTRLLNDYRHRVAGRLLVKVDVEGHELAVLQGGAKVLALAETVVVELQQDPDIFLGSPRPAAVDAFLRAHGLAFAGVADAFAAPGGRLLQFDGVWQRVS